MLDLLTTRTCEICWAEVKEEIWYLHQAWHAGRKHHDVPQTSTCDTCSSVIQRDKEIEHMEWHNYMEERCAQLIQ